MSTTKQQRHQAIAELVTSRAITSQGLLGRQLAKRGHRVSQATLSRDIEKLGIVKSNRGYRLPDDVAASSRPYHAVEVGTLRRLVVKVASAMNHVVIRTSPGGAHPVGRAIDEEHGLVVLGTIAGDDTVLVVLRTVEDAEAFRARFLERLG